MDRQTLLKAALALPESDRCLLVEELLESLPQDLGDVSEEAWLAELQRRSDEIDQGRVELIPWEQLKAEQD